MLSLAPRIFVSAAREDDTWCRAFVEALRWSGADVLEASRDEAGAPSRAQTGPLSSPPPAGAADELERALLSRPIVIVVLSPAAAVAPALRQAVEAAVRRRETEPERLVLAVAASATAPPVSWPAIERITGPNGAGLAPAEAAARVRARLAGVALAAPSSSMPLVPIPSQEARARDAWERGKVLRAQGRAQEALVVYDQALVADATLAPIWYSKGTLLAELGRDDEALIALDRALECDATLVLAWHAKGRIHLAARSAHDALPAFEQAVRLDPAHASAWVGKGDTFCLSRRYADALEAYERALELAERDAEVWVRVGNVLQMLRRHPETRQALRRARTLRQGQEPEDRDWDEEALDAYERALALDPQHALAWTNKIRLLEELGHRREARAARRERDDALEDDIAARETRYTRRSDGAR